MFLLCSLSKYKSKNLRMANNYEIMRVPTYGSTQKHFNFLFTLVYTWNFKQLKTKTASVLSLNAAGNQVF